jgi:uncharacterized protein (TIGR03435 family)
MQRQLACAVAFMFGSFLLIPAQPPLFEAQSREATNAARPSFEVASVRRSRLGENRTWHALPNRFTARNLPIDFLVRIAYGQDMGQFGFQFLKGDLKEGPSWIHSDGYDVDGKVEDSLAKQMGNLDCRGMFFAHSCGGIGPIMLMLQSLLAERFKLQARRETAEGPLYTLVVTKHGPKFLKTTFPLDDFGALGKPSPDLCQAGMGCALDYTSMDQLAFWLSMFPEIGRPVINKTGIKGGHYIHLQWASEQPGNGNATTGAAPQVGPSIFAALQEQLGLKLESTKGAVDVIVIDHIERPSEN